VTGSGESKTAWVVDYTDRGKRRLKTFAKKRDADSYSAKVT
jgi:integrase